MEPTSPTKAVRTSPTWYPSPESTISKSETWPAKSTWMLALRLWPYWPAVPEIMFMLAPMPAWLKQTYFAVCTCAVGLITISTKDPTCPNGPFWI